MNRTVTMIALLQATVITWGTLYVGAMMKFQETNPRFHPGWLPVFVREAGFVLLAIPVVWVAATLCAARSHVSSWFGIGLLAVGILSVPFAIKEYLELGTMVAFRSSLF